MVYDVAYVDLTHSDGPMANAAAAPRPSNPPSRKSPLSSMYVRVLTCLLQLDSDDEDDDSGSDVNVGRARKRVKASHSRPCMSSGAFPPPPC